MPMPTLAKPMLQLTTQKADVFLVGHFSNVLQEAYERRGLVAVQIDYRSSIKPGRLHIQGDFRPVLEPLLCSHPHAIVIASLPCKNIAL